MSSVAKKILMGSGAVDDYEIDQSVVFSGSQYFHRTPGSAGNQSTWTWSGWVKRGDMDDSASPQAFFGVGDGNSSQSDSTWFWMGWYDGGDIYIQTWSNTIKYVTNRKCRDPSAWYHVCVVLDTTESSSGDRVKLFLNGVQETSFGTSTAPSEDSTFAVNSTNQHRVGGVNRPTYDYPFKGYMSEIHFIDGTALTPSSFGETDSDTGQWIPKEAAGLTYGTNGFYLKFVSGAEGTDSSGEGNNYTAVDGSSSTIDKKVVLDTPTNNFAVMNPLFPNLTTSPSTAEGNLVLNGRAGTYTTAVGTIGIRTGAWYWEYYIGAISGGGTHLPGIVQGFAGTLSVYPGYDTSGYLKGISYWNGGNIYGATPAGGTDGSTIATGQTTSGAGDVIGFAADIPNGTLKIYKNGSLLYTVSSIGTTQDWLTAFCNYSTSEWGVVNFGQSGKFIGATTGGGNTDANGYGDFKYAVPSGYLALCSKNLATPTIKKPTDYVNPVIYTGNGSTNHDISGVGFQPEFTWIKNRTTGQSDFHVLHDVVRGAGNALFSNLDSDESDNSEYFGPFQTDGFRLSPTTVGDAYNASSENYVSWNWLAGGTPTATNSAGAGATPTAGSVKIDGANLGSALAGSIAATKLSANTTSGFSIVTYPGGSGTVAHGLGVTPKLVLQKKYDASGDWLSYTSAVDGTADAVRLNTTAGAVAADPATLATSTVFSTLIGGNNTVAYCFAEVEGYSKIGNYEGNNNDNGPFILTGFRPAYLLIKYADNDDESWWILDDARDTYNPTGDVAWANLNAAAYDYGEMLDITANGFKIKENNGGVNGYLNGTYIYMAFAEFPFKYANAR